MTADFGDEQEFLEDFGERGLTSSQLEVLLERARTTDDRELRLLVKQHRLLQRVAEELLERVERSTAVDEAARDQGIGLARLVIRGSQAGAG
jgi:hypothetical protein